MQPLAALPEDARLKIRGVLTDIDDTLSTDGKITGEAYLAMQRLHAAGRLLVPVTGRPAGWCDHIARMWPVDAVVGENDALTCFTMASTASCGFATRRALKSVAEIAAVPMP